MLLIRKSIKLFTFILLLSLLCPLTYAATINVPADQPTIQAGINIAQNGDTVLVDDGIYKGEGNVNIDFKGKRITVKSRNGAVETIIVCEEKTGTVGFNFNNNEKDTSVLEGFTIRNGFHDMAGGILVEYSSPTINNCVIEGNTEKTGIGIWCYNSDPIITGCIVTHSSYGIHTWGVEYENLVKLIEDDLQPIIKDCTISNNSGVGISCLQDVNVSIENCTIINNDKRGIKFIYFASGDITNCHITQNSGGGLECVEYSRMTIKDSRIDHNTAKNGGGISRGPTSRLNVTNSLIVNNTALYYGGGIESIGKTGIVEIKNCTISKNTAGVRGGGVFVSLFGSTFTIANSIVWGNSSNGTHAEFFTSGRGVTIQSCNIKDGLDGIGQNPDEGDIIYENNIDENPLFVDEDSGNFRLKANSPAANMGAYVREGSLSVTPSGKRIVKWGDLKRKSRSSSFFK